MVIGIAAGYEEHSLGEDGTGHELLGRAVDYPVLPARIRVVASDTQTAGHDHLLLARRIDNERHAIGARLIGPLGAPFLFSRCSVEGHNKAVAVLVAIKDNQV